MESLENQKKSFRILKAILGWGFKVTALLMFAFLFVGALNPARISPAVSRDVSVVKSAFYFQTYAQDIIDAKTAAEAAEKEALLNTLFPTKTDGVEKSSESNDFYADMAAKFASNTDEFKKKSTVDNSDDALSFGKAEKIKVQKFGKIWKDFSEHNKALASAVNTGRIGSILTFVAVLITLAGVFVSCGYGKIKKLGQLITAVGSVLVAVSMVTFVIAFNQLSASPAAKYVTAVDPECIPVFIVFAALTFAMVLAVFFIEKVPESEKNVLSERPFQYTFRLLALLLFVLLFIPAANPARITSDINRSVSLFTTAVSYGTYTKNIQRAFVRGWLPESVIKIASIASIFSCIGIFACGVGSCMSIGNKKLKRISHFALFGGELVTLVSLFGIRHAYDLICSNPQADKVPPLEPACFMLYIVLIAIMLCCTAVSFIKTPAPEKDEKCHIDAPYQLFLMILPFLILVFIFSYLPLWGWRYAFFDYKAGETLSMDKWTGFKWFIEPFKSAATRNDILRVLGNTLVMSGLGIAFSWLPMIFAIFLAEIRSTAARKVIQTLTTIPNFISWVLVYAIAFCIFGTDGFISSLMVKLGVWEKGVNMLMGDKLIWLKMWAWGTWKGLGWSAIMYIAAISGIDQQLYEAATVDGAGRFQKIWHITIPELLPTYLVLLILSVSNILSNGMDQYLVFKNATNQQSIEVLDLYVYNLSFGSGSSGNIPFSTVVSMFKSLVSVILLFITNRISKAIRGTSIF